MGAKSKFTQDRLNRFAQALELGATLEIACQYAGFSYRQYRVWMVEAESAAERGKRSRYSSLPQIKADAEARGAVKLLAKMEKDGAGDWRAHAWKLERRFGYNRTERREMEHSGGIELQAAEILKRQVAELTDAQIEALAATYDDPER